MYQLIKTEDQEALVLKETGAFIPQSLGNRHYQEYLEWVAEGNEPEVING